MSKEHIINGEEDLMIKGSVIVRKDCKYQILRIQIFKYHRVVCCYSVWKGHLTFTEAGGYLSNLKM